MSINQNASAITFVPDPEQEDNAFSAFTFAPNRSSVHQQIQRNDRLQAQ